MTRLLLQEEPDLDLSISVTTRPRRPSEVDGVHYHFIDAERFARMRDAGELLEWAEVHGNLYATPREPVEAALAAGRDVLFDIDWQGTQQLARGDAGRHRARLRPAAVDEGAAARLERRAEDDRR